MNKKVSFLGCYQVHYQLGYQDSYLADKGVNVGDGVIRAGEGTIRGGATATRSTRGQDF